MGKHQLTGTPSRYDAICTQLCRDLKAKGVVLIVHEGREGNGMAVAARPAFAQFGMPEVLAPYLRMLADTIDGGVGPQGIGVDIPDEAGQA
jgi:hypothetical protein